MSSPLPRRSFLLGFAAALGVRASFARADAPSLELVLHAPTLTAGDRKTLRAELLATGGRFGPVMLTPAAEGTAVEVVRGRMTHDDAEQFVADDGRVGLRFAIPLAAHMAGTSVVRVHASALACDVRCDARETSAQLTLRVLRAPA